MNEPQHNLQKINGGIFFAKQAKRNTLQAKQALDVIRQEPGIAADDLYKKTSGGVSMIPAGYIVQRFDTSINDYRYYPVGQEPPALPKREPKEPVLVKCGAISIPTRVWNKVSLLRMPLNKRLFQFDAEDWRRFATYDNLKEADRLGVAGIVSIWRAMLDAGITPIYTVTIPLPGELKAALAKELE